MQRMKATDWLEAADIDEFYVCQSCGYEDDADHFERYCPRCGVDLDELEEQK